MPIVRHSRADIDQPKLKAELAARAEPTEKEIARQVAEDGDAWSDADIAEATPRCPTPSPEQIKALRRRLGLDQKQLARVLDISFEEIVQYERGLRQPSGPTAVLLRVICAEPHAAMRALKLENTD